MPVAGEALAQGVRQHGGRGGDERMMEGTPAEGFKFPPPLQGAALVRERQSYDLGVFLKLT